MSKNMELIKILNSAKILKKILENYFINLNKAAETREKKIAWCSSVGPVELLYSMDFEIYFPENHAAMIGISKAAAKYIPSTVSCGYSSNVCSYLTSDIGAFLNNETPLKKYGYKNVPAPDILVYNTNQCREIQEWFLFYARKFDVPVIGINTPLGIDKISDELIRYISSQIKDLIKPLETVSNKTFDLDKYREVLKLSKRACELWKRVLEINENVPVPITFFDAAIHMAPVVLMRGTKQVVEYYQILLEELKIRLQNNISSIQKETYRIFWDGMPIWCAFSSMANMFAEMDSSIVASTYCNSWIFDSFEPAIPFESTARAYTELFICRSDKVKEKYLSEMLLRYKVDGIVYHDSKTCLRNSNNHYGLPDRLKMQTKIPYFEISADLNDPRLFNEDTVRIQIETFIEQLRSRRK